MASPARCPSSPTQEVGPEAFVSAAAGSHTTRDLEHPPEVPDRGNTAFFFRDLGEVS